MSDFDFDIDLLIFLVEARPVMWDKTDDIYKDRKETKKARHSKIIKNLFASSRRSPNSV